MNKKKNWKSKLPHWKKIVLWTFRLGAFGFLCLAALFVYFWITLPTPQELMNRSVPESTKIFDRNSVLLYEVHGEYKRTLVETKDISQDLRDATVAIEDKDFYKHGGVSPWAIFRTIITDIIKRKTAGASTITQQFVKNAVLTRDKTAIRKLKEIFLAVQIDAKYSKEDILKFYLNEIPYGRNAYGIEAASQAYFNKSAKDLSLAESSYLAALPQAPSYYSPISNRKVLDGRAHTVLKAMKDQNYITDEEYQKALAENVNFQQAKTALVAPHFVLYVQDYLASKYGEKTLEEGGLKVYTTLDSELQKKAEKIVKDSVEKNAKKYNANNAGLVAIDPKTGQILAMVGSKDYFGTSEPEGCVGKKCKFDPNVNVTLSPLQPGSSFKPYVYMTAFKKEHGYSPATMLMDVNTNFGTFNGKAYEPHNYNGQNYGPVSMRTGLAGSLNIPAVKTLSLVGVDNATQTARDLGITTPLQDCGLSLVLGSCEVKLLDHTAAMSVIANGGKKNDKTAILKIQDKTGNVLEEWKQNEQEVVDPKAVYQLISIMTDNNARSYVFGSNSPLAFNDRKVACKTGTTNNWHDGWTMCFTPSIAVGVWSGNNNGELLKKGADGVFVAAPITHAFLVEALKGKASEEFPRPNGIVDVVVDAVSGKLPTQFTQSTKSEVFADYNQPKDYDDVHVGIKVDTTTGEPATELTPPDQIGIKTYTVFHSERRNNPSWEDPVVRWALEKGYTYPPGSGVVIPPDGTNPGGADAFELNITNPSDNNAIFQLPFTVSATVPGTIQVARMDVSIDGNIVASVNTGELTTQINKKLPDGEHTVVVKVIDKQGSTASTSVNVNYSINSGLFISKPQNGDTLNLPATIYALSQQNYGQIVFYSQIGTNAPKILGQAEPIDNSGTYRYELELTDIPDKGQVKIYAKTLSGITSNKASVIIP